LRKSEEGGGRGGEEEETVKGELVSLPQLLPFNCKKERSKSRKRKSLVLQRKQKKDKGSKKDPL